MHYDCEWKPHQDAVHWIHLARAPEKGLQFWQTRSHAIIVHDSVPADCIEKAVSLKGDITLYQSPSTRRPAPNISLKDVCKLRQQQQHLEEHKEISSGAEPRHPKEHRETCCGGGESIQSWSQNPRNPTKCSARRSRKNVQTFKIWLTSCDLNAEPSRSLPMWKRKENSTGSAKHQNVQFENWTMWCMPCALAGTEKKKLKDDSRGAKHGLSQWQYDHWKAGDARKGARKKGKDFIVQRWQEDETYRASQTVHGWTEEYCRYLDDLSPIHMSYVATWKERSRCENSLVLGLNDGPHPGRMTNREDFPQAARALGALQRHQGRVNGLRISRISCVCVQVR